MYVLSNDNKLQLNVNTKQLPSQATQVHHIASRSLPWKICELQASYISPTSPKKRGQSEIFLCKSWVEPAFQLVKYATWEGAPFPFPLKNFQDFKMGGGPVSTASGQLRVGFSYFLLLDCFNLWGGGLVVPPLLLQCLYTWSHCTLFHCISMCCTVSKLIALCQNAVHCM